MPILDRIKMSAVVFVTDGRTTGARPLPVPREKSMRGWVAAHGQGLEYHRGNVFLLAPTSNTYVL
jgi:hypothetical protein